MVSKCCQCGRKINWLEDTAADEKNRDVCMDCYKEWEEKMKLQGEDETTERARWLKKISKLLKPKIGEFLFFLGILGLFLGAIIHLKDALPTEIKYGGITAQLIIWTLVSISLIVIGCFIKKKGFSRKMLTNHIKGYFSQIIATVSTTLIVIVLITNIKFKLVYVIGILIVSFLLYILSEEVKE
jgi:cation transport ATPase